MPDKPLSWSELSLFERDRDAWRRRYIDGVSDAATAEMEFGTLIHGAIENPHLPLVEILTKKGHAISEIQLVRKIMNRLESRRPIASEQVVKAETRTGIPLIAIFDGLNKYHRELDEYKTTTNKDAWKQYQVDTNGQLSFYAYVWKLTMHSYFREMRLHRIYYNFKELEYGVSTLYTTRGPADISVMADRIDRAVAAMKMYRLWDKRLTKKQRNALGQKKLI